MKYFRDNYNLVQRIPHALPLFLLIMLSGVAEGIGLSALVPVVSSLTGELSGGKLGVPFNILPDLLQAAGLEASFSLMLFTTLIIMLLSFLLVHLQDRAVFRARYLFLEQLRNRAADAIFAAKWEHLSDLSSGSVTNVVLHESDRGTEAVIALLNMMAISVQLLIYAVFALLLSWQMFLVALITVLIAALTAKRLIRAVRRMGKQSVDIDTLFSRRLVDFVRGVKLLKATSTEGAVVDQLQQSNHDGCDAKRRIVINQSLMRFELQAMISIAMVLILALAVEVLQVQVAVLLVFMFIVMRLAPRFSTFQGQYHNYSAFRPALDTVDVLIEAAGRDREPVQQSAGKFNGIRQAIVLRDVSYHYPEADNNALDEVNLEIGVREFVALVGRSGSGKSTTLDLLSGLIQPYGGKVMVDDVDLREIDRQSYRQQIGFVSQESIFFHGTIRQNLCLGLPLCDEQLVQRCLAIAQIDGFVNSLPDGLETELGEAGVKLSGGQRQRLAIARALIREPGLLILDEATSSLDSESEQGFQSALESVAHEYTLVVVAHRLSTIRKADRIYVFDQGRVVQSGSYKQLVQQPGCFMDLLSAQDVA